MNNELLPPLTNIDALNNSLDTPALDPVVLSIANDYLAGDSIELIAESYGISRDRVTSVLDKKEVQSYVDSVFATQGYLNRSKQIDVINRVIDAKLEEALETGVFTKKDLLDWMKHLQDVQTTLKPKESGPKVAVQINNYERLMKDLME